MRHQDHAAGDLVAVLLQDAAPDARRDRHPGHLGEANRAGLAGCQGDVLEIEQSLIGSRTIRHRRGGMHPASRPRARRIRPWP